MNAGVTLVRTMRPQRRLLIAWMALASKRPGPAALVTEQAPGSALATLLSWTRRSGRGALPLAS